MWGHSEHPGRVALVTGCSSGIGRAVALQLSSDGYTVWAAARRAALLAELALEDPNKRIIASPVDLTKQVDVEELVGRIRAATPVVAVLVHAAGIYSSGRIDTTPDGTLRELYEVNVESAYRLTHKMLPLMARPSGIVFLNSSQGLHASASTGQYAASMHARRALADSLRSETGNDGVRVTSIHLGRTATPLQRDIYAEHGWEYRPSLLLQPEEVATIVATIVGLPQTAEVTDISMRPAIKSY